MFRWWEIVELNVANNWKFQNILKNPTSDRKNHGEGDDVDDN